MGRPIPLPCAHSGCDNVRTADATGVAFTAQCCFPKKDQSLNHQLWACCKEHQKSTLVEIMRDMPYTSLPQPKPQELSALIS